MQNNNFLTILNQNKILIYAILYFLFYQFKFNLKSLLEFKNLILICLYFISFLFINNLRFLWTN